ncbi:MAG: UvrD-helicase domain-containing protein, partial [Oligoflexia bacterium]|nr:UvrD-helicase domain-containing protein [Oligoflexia bacterium]
MSDLLKKPLIKAGAGTGKTKTLIQSVYNVFHQLTSDKGRAPKLIVCTFTRKASQELKERLFETALKEIENLSNGNDLKKAPAFLNYLQSSFLQVSTIDGVLNHFLKKYGLFINLNPDFEISYANEELFDTLAEKFIYEKHFSLLQKFPYPVLRNIFLSYFKNRLKYGDISFYTADDFTDFRKERDRISSLIKSDNSLELLFKENYKLQILDSEKIKKLVKPAEIFCSEEFAPVFEELKKAGEDFFSLFLEKKKSSSVLDIEDLLLFSHNLLQEKPHIAQTFSEEWDYWFIDEYQDTSWLQEQIIQQLTKFKNVICVGDPGQSIYSFRGADPNVFNRREQKVKESVTRLETNYRSSAQLIAFYNDFFQADNFIKFKAPLQKKLSSVEPYLSFFTYNKEEKSCQKSVFQTLCHYIQKLRNQGVDYSQIAVLSSRNEDIVKTADYLRSDNLPLMLHSSKNFSQKRLILDSLFLLKFLINPYDDLNLKALLRTPYFRLWDQDLADSSYQYHSSEEGSLSFWSFIKEKYKEALFVKRLKSYLDNYKKHGLFESFKQALFDSALMDLSYFQDPTSSSIANLWKLLDLLNNNRFSELKLFYELLDQEEEKEPFKEAPPCEESASISLMTIHKSKGLEFEHVILLDFSMNVSSLQTGRKMEEIAVFDEMRQKMAVAVPIGGREKKKVKSYGHDLYNQVQNQIAISEKERLYYVAMTRAKESLAVFLPHIKAPVKNSWLKGVNYFSKVKGLLKKDDSSKTWTIHQGVYQQDNYSLTVLDCDTVNKEPQTFIKPAKELNPQPVIKSSEELKPQYAVKSSKELKPQPAIKSSKEPKPQP